MKNILIGLTILAGSVTAAVVPKMIVFGVQEKHGKDESIKALIAAMHKLNDRTPFMIDEYTRMDKVSIGSEADITYHYTFPSHEASDFTDSFIKNEMYESYRKPLCNSKEMVSAFNNGYKTSYEFTSGSGERIGEITIQKHNCLINEIGGRISSY